MGGRGLLTTSSSPHQCTLRLPDYSTIGPPKLPVKISLVSANSSIVAGVLPSTITRITPPCTAANSSQDRRAKSVVCLSSVAVCCMDSIQPLLVKVRVTHPWLVALVHAQLDTCDKPRHPGEAIPASCSGAMCTRDEGITPVIPASAPWRFSTGGRRSPPALSGAEPHRLCYPYGVPCVCHTTAQWIGSP